MSASFLDQDTIEQLKGAFRTLQDGEMTISLVHDECSHSGQA